MSGHEESPSKRIKTSVYENPNGFPFAHGKTLHMDTQKGDVANRIITVGAVDRAEKIAKLLQNSKRVVSHRGFTTITGTYKEKAVSIVSIGMGVSMMDFFVRESRAIIDGPVAIIRFGTCGGLAADAMPGTVVVATGGSGCIYRNPNAFSSSSSSDADHLKLNPYIYYDIAPSDSKLNALVVSHLVKQLGEDAVATGTNITADSFYSSQGRVDSDNFDDRNTHLIDDVIAHYPAVKSMEMESFALLHLAHCAKKPTYATAAAIVVANRKTTDVVDAETIDRLEQQGGLALLDALWEVEL